MIDLSTSYAGLTLKNPLVVSASPLCAVPANLEHMEEAGAAAIVLHSLFEEQIEIESNQLDRVLTETADGFAEALSYFPDVGAYRIGADDYLEHLRKAKATVKIPVFGSLNGISAGGWIRYAKLMEEAGADGIELNIYFIPTNPNQDSATVEHRYLQLTQSVKAQVKVPVAVKISPYFTSMAHLAKRLDGAGADALVMFNRFYQPDFDLEALEVVPNLQLSRSETLKLRLHWVAVLFGQIKADMAVTGGVHTPEDVIKCMVAGGRVAMLTSALLERGIDYIHPLLAGVQEWMEKHEYESIRQMQGSMSMKNVPNPAAFERGNYMKVLGSYALDAAKK